MSTTDAVFWRKTGRRGDRIYWRNQPPRNISHPWLTRVMRSSQERVIGQDDKGNDVTGQDRVWAVTINPGFVNAEEPIYHRQYLEKHIVDGAIKMKAAYEDVSLLDGPEIIIMNRRSNFATTGTPLPFFREMGITGTDSGVTVGESGITVDATVEKPKRRLLQTVIYLALARPTQRLEATIPGNVLAGDTIDYRVIYDARALQATGMRPRIEVNGVMPQSPPAGTIGRLYEDSGFDYLEICTVYFVSPEDFTASTNENDPPFKRGDVPTKDWLPYVKHNLFWNLNYAPKTEAPWQSVGGLLDMTVAAFAGRYTVAVGAIASSIDAAIDEALSMAFNAASNRGRFWTA